MNKITPQKALIWGSAAATSLGIAFSMAVRFSPLMVAPRLDKLAYFLSLLPLCVIFTVWLFSSIITPLTQTLTFKGFLLVTFSSFAVMASILALFYSVPPFPEQHEFNLTVMDVGNPMSHGTQVELAAISTVAFPAGSYKRMPANDLALDGLWRGTNSGYGLVGQPGASIKYSRYMQAGIALRFATGPTSGKVRIEWDGQTQTVDLYNAHSKFEVLLLEPGFDLRRAQLTHQILAGGAILADFWSASLLFFISGLSIIRLLRERTVTLRQPVLLAAIVISIFLLQGGALAINRPVEFHNDPLEAVVREALHRSDGAIYHRHLRTMRVLDASSRRMTQLDGIELMPNLVELDLSGNRLIDISGLAGLTHLEKLNLRGNDVREISPLAGLAALEYLNLYDNRNIRNIGPLAGLVNLKTLILANVPVGAQTADLSGLTQLKKLNLRNTGVNDLSFLSMLNDLEYLNLYGNAGIRSLAAISGLDDLETLILAQVSTGGDLGFLRDLKRLRNLNLRSSGVTNLEDLAGLTRLEYLNLHSNAEIRTIQSLEGLTRLETLVLANVPVGTEIEIVRNFPHLQVLNVRNTGLIDLAPIGDLMSHGGLQDDPKRSVAAGLDIRENPIAKTGGDDFSTVRPYWDFISDRRPLMLPFYAALEVPEFSLPAGFYEAEFHLTLVSDLPGAQIHFTLDGSQPTLDSPLYGEPLVIRERTSESNDISAIEDIAANYRVPFHMVTKGTVVRAVAIHPQTGESSAVVTQTYFIGKELVKRYVLPVVSLVGDPMDFFDPQNGIYVLGERYAALKDADLTEDERQTVANFNQRGRDWERSVSVEIFEPGGDYFSQDGGVRVHGAGSRRNPQKSLRIYARPEYDIESNFTYPLFGGKEGILGAAYPVFILRSGGQDWAVSQLRDAFVQRLSEGTGLDRQAGRFVITFLNGEYWGIYHLQERYDAAYLENHYSIPKGQGVILGVGGALISGEPGDEVSYNQMLHFIRENDLAVQANYELLNTMMDISSYVDYLTLNIFAANQDWPDKNVVLWRMKTESYQPDAPAGQDGRWRWMLNDLDISFGLKYDEGDITQDTLSQAQLPGSSGFLTRELLKNESFRQEFVQRFEQHLVSTFAPERAGAMLEQAAADLRSYMDEFFARWGTGSVEEWEEEIALMNKFAQERPMFIRELLRDVFDK
jgi:hypothetical protein